MTRISTFKRPSVGTLRPKRDNTAWRRFINSPAWRAESKSFLRRHPACEECLKRDDLVPATEVHHTHGQDMEHAFDEDTLVALCRACHSRITRAVLIHG